MRYILIFLLIILPISMQARDVQTPLGVVSIEPVAQGLNEPWSLGFLPNGEVLITERGGRLLLLGANGERRAVSNVPAVQQGGQAGLFDVLIPAEFATNGLIYLSYAHADQSGTAVMVARLDLANARLEGGREIFKMSSPTRSGLHFGGRLVDDGDGVFLTLGERGEAHLAQDDRVDNGKLVRIQRDGSGYQKWSNGHRNPQGAAKDAAGILYVVEHGAKGGDEINRVKSGRNYGWPVISYGVNYNGSKIGEGTQKAGMEQPEFYWDPSIAPSGLAIHSGRNWNAAKGLFFVGSLKFGHIAIVNANGGFSQIGLIQSEETARVRDVREAPDGSLWFLSVNNGALYRISPK